MSAQTDRDPTDLGLAPPIEPTEHTCTAGWLDPDRGVPCLVCKPHLRLVNRPGIGPMWTVVRQRSRRTRGG